MTDSTPATAAFGAPYFVADDDDPDTVFITVPYAAKCIDRSRIRIYQLAAQGRVRTRTQHGRMLVAYTDLLAIYDTPNRVVADDLRLP